MSVAVLQSSMSSHFDLKNKQQYHSWSLPAEHCNTEDQVVVDDNRRQGSQFDVWSAIQAQKSTDAETQPAAQYVHPSMRLSSSLMSQKSLEICTESLGSETGSDGFSDDIVLPSPIQFEVKNDILQMEQEMDMDEDEQPTRWQRGKELTSVNYHCSIGRRSPPRSFPPPLPSISRRDGPCLHMRTHRRDGRLVVEAVHVPSQNYLHSQREGGRLLLSFVDATFDEPIEQEQELQENKVGEISQSVAMEEEIDEEEYEAENEEVEEEEEEVEVVDRGTVVEVKVSIQPQQQSGAAAAAKVHRSSLVINKFVGGTQSKNSVSENGEECVASVVKRAVASTTAAAAAVVASALSSTAEGSKVTRTLSLYDESGHYQWPLDNKLLFTSKQRNREELLHNMMRCSELRRPLFIYEPCCIASS